VIPCPRCKEPYLVRNLHPGAPRRLEGNTHCCKRCGFAWDYTLDRKGENELITKEGSKETSHQEGLRKIQT
jgi:hypothetical protein